MITVMPAKSTARPAVSTAAIAAVARLQPFVEPVAEAGEDEERVVDADAEADHRRQLRRELGGVEDVGAEGDQAEADAEREQRGERSAGPSPPPSRRSAAGSTTAASRPIAKEDVAFFFGADFLDRLAAELDLEAVAVGRLRRSSISFLMSSLFELVGGDVELDGRVGDLAVVADRGGAAVLVGAGDFADVRELLRPRRRRLPSSA